MSLQKNIHMKMSEIRFEHWIGIPLKELLCKCLSEDTIWPDPFVFEGIKKCRMCGKERAYILVSGYVSKKQRREWTAMITEEIINNFWKERRT